MLDVVSGALGAFLILMIVLLPHYRKEETDKREERDNPREAEALRRRLQETEDRALLAEERAVRAEERALRAEEKLARTFLVVYIRWATINHDVDLHVVDPSGAEFFYARKTVPGRPGELSEDSQMGPGNEVWELREAPPGRYRIYANLYSRHGNPRHAVVKGRVFFRDGSEPLPEITLTEAGRRRKKLVTVLVVEEDGSVRRTGR